MHWSIIQIFFYKYGKKNRKKKRKKKAQERKRGKKQKWCVNNFSVFLTNAILLELHFALCSSCIKIQDTSLKFYQNNHTCICTSLRYYFCLLKMCNLFLSANRFKSALGKIIWSVFFNWTISSSVIFNILLIVVCAVYI